MRYLIKVTEIEKKTEFLLRQIDLIGANISSIENLKIKLSWNGDAKDAFVEKLNVYINNLKGIQNVLIDTVRYFGDYSSRYREEYISLKQKYSSLNMEDKNEHNYL